MTDAPTSRAMPSPESHPRLAPGCRLGENAEQLRVLQMPERALRLNGPSLEIVQRCDGKRTVREIISELQKLYSKADPLKVEQDILGYLALLQEQRALDFE
jgi:pyrroloquinoline quinone biosynthesis protein D